MERSVFHAMQLYIILFLRTICCCYYVDCLIVRFHPKANSLYVEVTHSQVVNVQNLSLLPQVKIHCDGAVPETP